MMLSQLCKLLMSILIYILMTTSAQAEQFEQNNVHINQLGSHSGQVFYMAFVENFSASCRSGVIYCPKTNPNCANFYALAIAAKITGKPLSRVTYDYNVDNDQMCYFWLIEIK